MVSFDQVPVLFSAQLRHSGGISSGANHIPVIIHRLAVKLHQAAAHALAEIQSKPLILIYMIFIRHMLGRSRHIVQRKKRRLP